MPSMLSETTTIADLVAHFPDMKERARKEVEGEEVEERTEEAKTADLEWFKSIFEGIDWQYIVIIVTYLVQILKENDPPGTVFLLEELEERIIKEETLKRLPPVLTKLLVAVQKAREN